jgi:hypothetical protein
MKPDELKPLWEISPEEVAQIASPLTSWINQLPREAIEKFEKYAYPGMTIIALGGTLAPRMITEQNWTRRKRAEIASQKQQQVPQQQAPQQQVPQQQAGDPQLDRNNNVILSSLIGGSTL